MSATDTSPQSHTTPEPERSPLSSPPPNAPRPRTLARLATGSALVASAVGVVLTLLGRYFIPSVIITTPAEQFGDQFTSLIPLPLFEALLSTFDGNAKHIYVAGVIIVEALLTAAFGVAYIAARQVIRLRIMRASANVQSAMSSPSPLNRFLYAQFGRLAPGYFEAIFIVLLLWLLSAGVVSPLIGGGFFGVNLLGGSGLVFLAELAPNGIFALLFIRLFRSTLASFALTETEATEAEEAPATAHEQQAQANEAADQPDQADQPPLWPRVRRPVRGAPMANAAAQAEGVFSRRALVRQGILAAVILGGGALIWEALSNGLGAALGIGGSVRPPLAIGGAPTRIVPPPKPVYGPWTNVPGQTPEVTTPQNFYYVSKNLVSDPSINGATWQLTIDGLVEHPYMLSYHQLQALPAINQYHTLECISNVVGGNLMSNGAFTGVSLADALNKAGIKQGASEVVFYGADGYSDRLHLSQALDPNSLIAYLLDGAPLPTAHGFPARLLIPGLYGMKNGKWLTRLQVISGDYQGYWEQRGWTPEAHVKMTSRIDTPHDGDFLMARSTYIAGVAYSGAAGIARVDVTLDGGRSWTPTTLRRPLGALTWVLWEYRWTPASGTYVIGVRAIDLNGNVQTPVEAPTLPDGASGYDAITVTVR